MVTVPKEKTFPRGGRVDRTDVPRRKIPDWCNNKFSDRKKKGTQIRKRKLKTKAPGHGMNEVDEIDMSDVTNTQSQSFNGIRPYTGSLKYNAIAEGMLILGCIYKIEPYKLGISLPGHCIGYVPITNISEPYRQALSSIVNSSVSSDIYYLRDMFYIGQHVVTKVVKKEYDGNKSNVVLSLSPNDIHSDCSNKDICKQSVYIAAVSSIEEKVYVMDLGIKSVRAVLKKDNAETFKRVWNEGKELGIGQLVRCAVLSVSTENLVSTITLTADPYLVAKASSSKDGCTLKGILPGMLFNVTVSRHVFPSGIQVRLSDNIVGYVPQNHLPRAFKSPEDFQLGSVHPARVLYISLSGAIFFTMRKNVCSAQLPVSPFKALKAGSVVKKAVVWNISDTALTVKLTKSDNVSFKGVIPESHIDRKHQPQDSDFSLAAQLANEFPVGTEVTCRVMDYCYMEQYYMCTMKKSLMKEAYLHPSSLKIGAVVSCVIKQINHHGITVMLGKQSPVSGFVPQLHISDVPLSHPEKKFKINQICTARVLKLDNCVHLTMKESLIQSTSIVASYDAAEIGKKYVGTVIHRSTSGILVEFFSGFVGWVHRSMLTKRMIQPSDIETLFYLGQVVHCTVIGKDSTSQRVTLSLVKTDIVFDNGMMNSTNHDNTNKNIMQSGDGDKVRSEDDTIENAKSEGSFLKSDCQKENKSQVKKSKKKSQNNTDNSEAHVVPKKKQKLIAFESKGSGDDPNAAVKKSKKTDDALQCVGKDRKRSHSKSVNAEIGETKSKEMPSKKKSSNSVEICQGLDETRKQRKLSTELTGEVSDNSISASKSPKSSRKDKINNSDVKDTDAKLEMSSKIKNDGKLTKKKKVKKITSDTVCSPSDTDAGLSANPIYDEGSKGSKNMGEKSKKGATNREKLVEKANSCGESDTWPEPSDEGYVTSDKLITSTKDGTKKKKKRKSQTPNEDKKTKGEDTDSLDEAKTDFTTGNELVELPSDGTKKKRKRKRKSIENTDTKPSDNKRTAVVETDSDLAEEAATGDANKPVELPSDRTKRKRKSRENTGVKPSEKKTIGEHTGSDSAEEADSDDPSKPVELPSLSVTTGFVWDATPNSLPAVARTSCDEDSSDDEDSNVQNKKVKRSRQAIIAEKRHQAQLEEARLRSIEQRLMDPEQLPQTADEFDRLVLASPDNSMVWLQYMAYHIQATEIDKARNVATRALKTISFREEQEKLNVWVALLNLENLYGTNDSVKSTFEEAVRLNDPYKVYTQMLQIYADSHKLTEGDELITAMMKKFKTVKDMWINVATFYMKSGQMVKARALLQRALNNLEKKEHVSVISQFALLENKLGSKERAQTLMEQILTSYPKRVDVWSVYVDMLVKSNLISMARQVLERAVAQRLQSHKMKALFKKFLSFEEAHGTEEGANRVRQLALEYVEAATATNTE